VAFVAANSGLDLDESEGLGSCGGAVAIYVNLRTCRAIPSCTVYSFIVGNFIYSTEYLFALNQTLSLKGTRGFWRVVAVIHALYCLITSCLAKSISAGNI
jgi:hypothetical protein